MSSKMVTPTDLMIMSLTYILFWITSYITSTMNKAKLTPSISCSSLLSITMSSIGSNYECTCVSLDLARSTWLSFSFNKSSKFSIWKQQWMRFILHDVKIVLNLFLRHSILSLYLLAGNSNLKLWIFLLNCKYLDNEARDFFSYGGFYLPFIH